MPPSGDRCLDVEQSFVAESALRHDGPRLGGRGDERGWPTKKIVIPDLIRDPSKGRPPLTQFHQRIVLPAGKRHAIAFLEASRMEELGGDRRHIEIGAHFRRAVVETDGAELFCKEMAAVIVGAGDSLGNILMPLGPEAQRRRLISAWRFLKCQ